MKHLEDKRPEPAQFDALLENLTRQQSMPYRWQPSTPYRCRDPNTNFVYERPQLCATGDVTLSGPPVAELRQTPQPEAVASPPPRPGTVVPGPPAALIAAFFCSGLADEPCTLNHIFKDDLAACEEFSSKWNASAKLPIEELPEGNRRFLANNPTYNPHMVCLRKAPVAPSWIRP
jgi:hypothetical protein